LPGSNSFNQGWWRKRMERRQRLRCWFTAT
jgi:hypothetical protein